jgi:hypothetical protein
MSSCDRTASRPRRPYGTKKFAEPVSLSFTALVDFPLAGTVLEFGFDLLGFRARRNQESRASSEAMQGVTDTLRPQFAEIQLSTFPQQTAQHVDNTRSAAEVGFRSVPHLRPPSFSGGVTSFIWGLVFGLFLWLGMLAVGVSGATSFIVGAVAGFGIFLYVRAYGADAPVPPRGRSGERAR